MTFAMRLGIYSQAVGWFWSNWFDWTWFHVSKKGRGGKKRSKKLL